MAEDPLQILGKQYMQLAEEPYELTVEKGNGRKSEVFRLSIAKCDIVHATGLSHLSSYGGFGDKSVSTRESIAKALANGDHSIANLQTVAGFKDGIFQTYNSDTGQRCTIEERVLKVGPIVDILESAKHSISVYAQQTSYVNLPQKAPDARKHPVRASQIKTDYIIAIPYGKNPHRDERIYLFAHKCGIDKQSGAIKINIHSAIADCVDFVQGQKKIGSVVHEKALTLSSHKNVIAQREVYIHPEYDKRIKISGKVEQLGMMRNESGSGDGYFRVRDELLALLETRKDYVQAATLLEEQKRKTQDGDIKEFIDDELKEIHQKVTELETGHGVGNSGMSFKVSPSGAIAIQQTVSPVQAIQEFISVAKFKIECKIRSLFPKKEDFSASRGEQKPLSIEKEESFEIKETSKSEQKMSREEMLKAIQEIRAELELTQPSPAKEEPVPEVKTPVQEKHKTHSIHKQQEFAR